MKDFLLTRRQFGKTAAGILVTFTLAPESLLRLAGHGCQGRAVVADVEHLVGNDEVVRCVRGDLHVVAHDSGSPAAGGHGACVGVGQ